MQLDMKTRTNIITYLTKMTNCTESYLNSLYDIQLYAMYQKYSRSIFQLSQEILDLQQQNPFKSQIYTKDELIKMPYNQLIEIKNNFKRKEGEPVNLSNLDNSPEEKEPEPEDYEFLTLEEVSQMYGPSAKEYSSKNLSKKGILLDCANTNQTVEMSESKELKEKLIGFLIEAHQRGIIYMPISKEKLETYSVEAIKTLYKKEFKEDLTYPSLDEIIMRLYLS